MIPLINQAMVLGYTASQILTYIMNKMPNLASNVTNARKRGYNDEDILKYLQNKIPVKNEKMVNKHANELDQYLSQQGIKTREERANDRNKAIKTAMGIGIGALGAYKAYQNYSGIASNLLQTLGQPRQPPGTSPVPPQPGQPQGPIAPQQGQIQVQQTPAQPQPPAPIAPQPTPSPMVQTPGQQINQQQMTPAQPQQIAQAAQAPQVEPQIEPIGQEQIEAAPELSPEMDFLKKRNLVPKIQAMVKAGKPKEKILEYLKKNIPMMEQEYLRTVGKKGESLDQKLGNIVDRFFTSQSAEMPKQEAKISKGAEVLTPSGIGTVKAEDKTGLIVESEGKAHKIPASEAITSPLPEKDLGDLYTELVNKIPESERSSMINVAGYDPNVNEFIFMPHDGALYVYKDIPPEFADKLKSALFQAKTTGSNFYGAWTKGEESRGAGLSALIKELQSLYGGKGKEYVRKYEKIYDFFALPKQAVKEREKREREERKKRKQRPS